MKWIIKKRLLSRIAAAMMMLLLAAPQHTTAEVNPSSPELKSVTIRVLDEETGQPIPGAKISAPYLNFRSITKTNLPPPSLTGADGQGDFRYPVIERQNFGFGVQHSN